MSDEQDKFDQDLKDLGSDMSRSNYSKLIKQIKEKHNKKLTTPNSVILLYLNHGRDILGTITLNDLGEQIIKDNGIKAIFMASMDNKGTITFDGIGGPKIEQGGFRGPRKKEFTEKYITNRKDNVINLSDYEDSDYEDRKPTIVNFGKFYGNPIPELQTKGFTDDQSFLYSNLSDKEQESFESGVKNIVKKIAVKELPLILSIERTVKGLYLPKGYTAEIWEDADKFNVYMKIKNTSHDEVEVSTSTIVLLDNTTSELIKVRDEFYKEFPIIHELIRECVVRMEKSKKR